MKEKEKKKSEKNKNKIVIASNIKIHNKTLETKKEKRIENYKKKQPFNISSALFTHHPYSILEIKTTATRITTTKKGRKEIKREIKAQND